MAIESGSFGIGLVDRGSDCIGLFFFGGRSSSGLVAEIWQHQGILRAFQNLAKGALPKLTGYAFGPVNDALSWLPILEYGLGAAIGIR